MTSFHPLEDRVLLQEVEEDAITASGIVLPDSARSGDQVHLATVIAAGPGFTSHEGTVLPMTVKVGDTVYAPKFAGQEIKLDGETYRLLRQVDILGIAR